MKHAHLVLDADLLEEVVRVSGERTYSAAVTRAMRDLVGRARARRILELKGSGLWEGDLSEMREDRSPRPRRTAAPGKAAPARSSKGRRAPR